MPDNTTALGGQLVYRFSLKKGFKIGGGGLYAANYRNIRSPNKAFGYGAAFADIMQFIGRRQKWSFGGQFGAGFYKEDFYANKLNARLYLSISYNYRAIVSEKLLIITSLLTGYRDFHYDYRVAAKSLPLVGLKAGIVF